MPPRYVKPYLGDDAADAEATCEAVSRPTMHFLEEVKSAEQQSVMVLHRTRLMFIRQRRSFSDRPVSVDKGTPFSCCMLSV